jgi:hypothetical protein
MAKTPQTIFVKSELQCYFPFAFLLRPCEGVPHLECRHRAFATACRKPILREDAFKLCDSELRMPRLLLDHQYREGTGDHRPSPASGRDWSELRRSNIQAMVRRIISRGLLPLTHLISKPEHHADNGICRTMVSWRSPAFTHELF